MTYSVTFWDWSLLAALLGATALDPFFVNRIKAAIESGKHPRARLFAYYLNIVTTWLSTIAVLMLWIAFRRPWQALRVGAFGPLLGVGLLLAGLYLWYMLRSRRRILARPETFARYREAFENLSVIVPRGPQERQLAAFVAITAGIGEEVLFRGFMLSLFMNLFGLWIGVLANIAIFAFAHAYQGRAGIIRTGAFGAAATIIVLATGSLVPAILIHTIQDLVAGDILSRIFSAARSSPNQEVHLERTMAPT